MLAKAAVPHCSSLVVACTSGQPGVKCRTFQPHLRIWCGAWPNGASPHPASLPLITTCRAKVRAQPHAEILAVKAMKESLGHKRSPHHTQCTCCAGSSNAQSSASWEVESKRVLHQRSASFSPFFQPYIFYSVAHTRRLVKPPRIPRRCGKWALLGDTPQARQRRWPGASRRAYTPGGSLGLGQSAHQVRLLQQPRLLAPRTCVSTSRQDHLAAATPADLCHVSFLPVRHKAQQAQCDGCATSPRCWAVMAGAQVRYVSRHEAPHKWWPGAWLTGSPGGRVRRHPAGRLSRSGKHLTSPANTVRLGCPSTTVGAAPKHTDRPRPGHVWLHRRAVRTHPHTIPHHITTLLSYSAT